MDVKKVYLCNIYINNAEKTVYKKNTVAFWGKTGIFIDLKSKERYKPGQFAAEKDHLYVDIGEMIPISNIIEIKKENVSKRKILKKYNKLTEERNECK